MMTTITRHAKAHPVQSVTTTKLTTKKLTKLEQLIVANTIKDLTDYPNCETLITSCCGDLNAMLTAMPPAILPRVKVLLGPGGDCTPACARRHVVQRLDAKFYRQILDRESLKLVAS